MCGGNCTHSHGGNHGNHSHHDHHDHGNHSHHDHDDHGAHGHGHGGGCSGHSHGFSSHGVYDMQLHIWAIFIIMAASLLGTVLPIIGKRLLNTESGRSTLVILKLFGAGVILSTAFVHMLTEANHTFLTGAVQSMVGYSSFPAVLAIAGMLATHLIQLLANHAINASRNSRPKTTASTSPIVPDQSGENADPERGEDNETKVSGEISVESHTSHHHDASACNTDAPQPTAHKHVTFDDIDHEGHTHSGGVLAATSHIREAQINVYLLELGIASHSVIIGITLGTSAGEEFLPLLIALTFHQFFEGIALSAIVAEANFKRLAMTLFMVVFYTLTTPIGIAIGIALRSWLASNDAQASLTVVILDSISAGILGYDGLVNVIVPHFKGRLYDQSSIVFRAFQIISLYLGAAAMSFIGIWA